MQIGAATALVTLACLAQASETMAQGIYIGGKGGFGSVNYTVKEGDQDVEGVTGESGLMAGIYAGYQTPSMFAVEVQLMYASKGFGSEAEDGDEFTVQYIQLPLLARLTISEKNAMNPRVFAGPIFGYETSCKWKEGGQLETVDCPFETNSTEAGLLFGGGVSFGDPIQFTFDVTFDFGLTNARGGGSNETTFKSNRLSFLLGIEYSFWEREEY